MAFKKAAPEQARLKVSLYGPPGSGKTFSTLLMAEGLAKARGKRIAYVDTERGTDFYAKPVPSRQTHPDAFDFDAIYTRSIAEISGEVYALDPKIYGVVVIDSISHVWDAAMDAYGGDKTRIGTIPMNAWSGIKRPYKKLLDFLINSMFDVFILGRQKNVFAENDEGETKKAGVTMRAEGETAYEPHICIRMENQINKADKTQTVSRVVAYVEKDRTGVLSGKMIINPTFATIEPLLPLLGDVQAIVDDPDERAARDAELMNTDAEAKAKAKEEKSLGLFRDFNSRIQGVGDLAAFATLMDEVKKQRRYLIEPHQDSLREIATGIRERLVKAVAPEVGT